MPEHLKDLYWEMLELGLKIKKININGYDEIECSYPNDTGYGKLKTHLMDFIDEGKLLSLLLAYIQ